MEIDASQHAIANVLYDIFFKELKGNNAKKLADLNLEIKKAYDKAGVPGDMRIQWFDVKTFCDTSAPHQNYPELMTSVVKARKTRYLVPAAYELARKFCKNDTYSSRRFYCLKNLHEAYQIVDEHPLFLPDAAYVKYKACVENFLSHYVALAQYSVRCTDRIGQFQWSFVPKFHFMNHIVDDALYLSPKAFWCYSGETMVGIVTRIAQSCLAGLPPWKVSQTLCIKYGVAKALQFEESS